MESECGRGYFSRLMGHKAMACCMVIANRLAKSANANYKNDIDTLVEKVLEEYDKRYGNTPCYIGTLSYPDLYEVGMSNNGLRILYDIVNAMPGAACERVFAVSDDFARTSGR